MLSTSGEINQTRVVRADMKAALSSLIALTLLFLLQESYALPLYLRMLFDEQHHQFHLVPALLLQVSIVVDQLRLFVQRWGENVDREAFIKHLEAVSDPDGSKPVEAAECWKQMLECDILVLPSVLLMSKIANANEWSAA